MTAYGRGPLQVVLDDIRAAKRAFGLSMERQEIFGPIPVGCTVYRYVNHMSGGKQWRVLPDPEKAK